MSLESIQLVDPGTGATARILPGFGFNCYSFRPVIDGQAIEVLWSAENFTSGQERPSHSGIPILFPFPGRIRGTEFTFAGRTYPLLAADGRGNAIHGFVLNRPWTVVEQSERRITGRFHASQVDPTLRDHWPADFLLTVSYELRGNCLSSQIEVRNPDTKPLPFGLGTHPYFRLPLGKTGERDACRVSVPVGEVWTLENMLPTGATRPAVGAHDLVNGKLFGETKFDDVYSSLKSSDGEWHRASIEDPENRRTLTLAFDREFKAAVVYNPPHREAICIEPYSCIPDPFILTEMGLDAGLRILAPGASVRFAIDIELL